MSDMGKRTVIFLGSLLCAVAVLYVYGRSIWVPVVQKLVGKRTVSQVLARYGAAAEQRLVPCFRKAGTPYPPTAVTLIALKEERRLELWVPRRGAWTFVRAYEIKGSSGTAGPKLRQGDRQVPEGLYRIVGLNPNSSFHLSLELDYPNAFDWERAKADGRSPLGGEIFIHGKDVSIGCLAMGDEAVEELFVLVSRVGVRNASVIIAPMDFRTHPPEPGKGLPDWVQGLYTNIRSELLKFRL